MYTQLRGSIIRLANAPEPSEAKSDILDDGQQIRTWDCTTA